MDTTDWGIHCLERAVARLQPEEPVANHLLGVPTVEAMLGIATDAGEIELERKQVLADIESRLYRKKAGRAGEEAVEQTLSEVIFPVGTQVFRNLSLLIRKNFRIEIDVLILTPVFALILEVKNIAGTLSFNEEEGKTVRIRENGEIDEFDCYVHQLDRQISGLNQFLAIHRITLPVHGVIVLSNQNTIVKKRPITLPLIYRKQLARHFRSLIATGPPLTPRAFDYLARLFSEGTPESKGLPLCEKMDFNPALFRPGVLCLICHRQITNARMRSWHCKTCDLPGREAVRQAVEDRLILIEPKITNKQCREFLQLRYSSQATRVLKSLQLVMSGRPPATSYHKEEAGPLKWAEDYVLNDSRDIRTGRDGM
ncbi:nuclease-related domain-containing protein [Bhargavaea ginsengi]|uniref:nuclease-related domain-containing protein n=1 Tax=Bhargavaea ginsengi TaxID=426757 RepID=UPI003C760955